MASAYHAAVLASAGGGAGDGAPAGAGPPRPRKSTMGCACTRAPIPSRIRRITRNTGLGDPAPAATPSPASAFHRPSVARHADATRLARASGEDGRAWTALGGCAPLRPVASGYCVGSGWSSWPHDRRNALSICVVAEGHAPRRGPLRRVLREPVDGAADGVEAGLEIQDAQHGLERRREDRLACPPTRLVLAASQPDEVAEPQRGRPAREVRAGDEGSPRRCQQAHRGAGLPREQPLGDDEPERGVPDEGETVLRDQRRVLVDVRGVGERAHEEAVIGEPVAERRFQGGDRRGGQRRGYQARYLRKASVALVPPKPKAFDSAVSTSCLRAWFGM